jgi:molybdopterin-guanine dinucleotide biosynthesis protein A
MSVANAAELNGLVLAGGRSTRMRRDKTRLEYAGRPQLERALDLLERRVTHCFVSVRADQLGEPVRGGFPVIPDRRPGLGPIGGIEAALHFRPGAAWLVLACDLPFLDDATVGHLIAQRAPGRLATAYRSRSDGLPEPLCAIYEPASLPSIEAWIAQGQNCPRQWLAHRDVELLELPAPRALDNVNTAEEYLVASAALGQQAVAQRRLNVRYFALLREQAGRPAESLQTPARTPQELYAQLQRDRGLNLAPQYLRVAINEEFADWEQPLADGDTIAFLPPVAGG